MDSRPLDLGPFAPPDDYQFEPELQSEPPREIPESTREGRYETKHRQASRVGLTIGVLAILLGELPFVKVLGLYFLPLAYLSWIGLGVLVLWAIGQARHKWRLGPYRYLRDGLPLVARVVALVKAPTAIVEGNTVSFAYTLSLEMKNPTTGELLQLAAKSSEFRGNAYQASYRVGDYVTAIYLPGEFPQSTRLYGFLDLLPGIGLVRREPESSSGVWRGPLIVAAITGFFSVLLWMIFAHGRYEPVAFDYRNAIVPMVLGAIVLGGAVLAVIYLDERRGRRRLAERNAAALASGEAMEVRNPSVWQQRGARGWFTWIMMVAGCLMLGAFAALSGCFTVNAWFDRSQPQLRPVQITKMTMTTHDLLFRHYDIEYLIPPGSEKCKYMTTPQHMAQFQNDLGVAEVCQGFLGWPWVRTIHPVAVQPAAAN